MDRDTLIELCSVRLDRALLKPESINPYDFVWCLLTLRILDFMRYTQYRNEICSRFCESKLVYKLVKKYGNDVLYRTGLLLLLAECKDVSEVANSLLTKLKEDSINMLRALRSLRIESLLLRLVFALEYVYPNDNDVKREILNLKENCKDAYYLRFYFENYRPRDLKERFLAMAYLLRKYDPAFAYKVLYAICETDNIEDALDTYLCSLALNQYLSFRSRVRKRLESLLKRIWRKLLDYLISKLLSKAL